MILKYGLFIILNMSIKKRVLFLSTISILTLFLGILIYFIDPTKKIILSNFSLSPILVFFFFVSALTYALTYFFIRNKVRSFIAVLLIISILFIQLLKVGNLIYIMLLLLIAILLDIFFRKDKKEQ